ncbi:hypothetical protein AB0J52_34645 [Spirillospora sp. NPDC049652]
MGVARPGGGFRHLSRTKAFTVGALCCAMVSVAVPAAAVEARADTATRTAGSADPYPPGHHGHPRHHHGHPRHHGHPWFPRPLDVLSGIALEKTADPMTFTGPGQPVRFHYHVSNIGTWPLINVVVMDDLPGLPAVECPTTSLLVDQSIDCTATYRTTDADVRAGSIHNVAVARGVTPNGLPPAYSEESAVTVRFAGNAALKVRKEAHPRVFGGAGQTIRFGYHVTNDGDVPLHEVGIIDHLPGLSAVHCDARTLDAGASTHCSATYRTTWKDVKRGHVRNVAVACGRTENGESVRSEPAETAVHAVRARIGLRKSVRPTTFWRAGQVLRFGYRVTNTGGVTLRHVGVVDRLRGLSEIRCSQRTLRPGESATCSASYRVTRHDVRAGSIRNRAYSVGHPSGWREPVCSRWTSATAYGHVAVTG